jgi:hypothetical protein
MSNSSDTQAAEKAAPPADLKALDDRLVGTWKISGEAEGETTWEWMEGGFFLIQRGWTRREGAEQKYLQIIGHDRTPGSVPADAITGRLYTDHGDTLAYVCEVDRRHDDDLDGREGLPRRVPRHVQPRRQHDRGELGLARRRLQGEDDPRTRIADRLEPRLSSARIQRRPRLTTKRDLASLASPRSSYER